MLADFTDMASAELECMNPHLDTLDKNFRRALSVSILKNDEFGKEIRLTCSMVPLATLSRWADPDWNSHQPEGNCQDDEISLRSFTASRPVGQDKFRLFPTIQGFVKASGIIQLSEERPMIKFMDLFSKANISSGYNYPPIGLSQSTREAFAVTAEAAGQNTAANFATYIPEMAWPLQIVKVVD